VTFYTPATSVMVKTVRNSTFMHSDFDVRSKYPNGSPVELKNAVVCCTMLCYVKELMTPSNTTKIY
jgi:hypothetical protein